MNKKILSIIVLILVQSNLCFGVELKFPNVCRLSAIETFIYSVIRYKHSLFLTTKDANFFIKTPFNGLKATPTQTFGNYLDSHRVIIPENLGKTSWHTSFVMDNKIGFIDGISLNVFYFDVESDNKFIAQQEIVWDTIKPPKDRIGEASSFEIKKHREIFKQNILATQGVKISGAANIPWLSNNQTYYLMFLTRVKDYPFILGYCDKTSLSCMIERFCYIQKYKFKIDGRYRGIAIDSKNKILLIGDFKDHSIHKFKFNSCLDIQYINTIKLPPKIKEISSVYLDIDSNLWVSSIAADNYTNSSVFCWNKEQWQ